ncbi:MAG: hypothetical protein IPN15_08915 [Saprospiraceae bacterium]|nr:hypothetical protein [Candidatus Vicinibacter affinis]
MAKNGKSGDGHRNGSVKDRTQVENPKTGLYVKRDTETGQFIDVKTTGGKFKGVRKEKISNDLDTIVWQNPAMKWILFI